MAAGGRAMSTVIGPKIGLPSKGASFGGGHRHARGGSNVHEVGIGGVIFLEGIRDFDTRRGLSARRAFRGRGIGRISVGGNGLGMAGVPVRLGVGTLADLVEDLQVVVEDGSDDRDHIGLDDSGADGLGAAYTDVDDTLEG